ncbi:MAG: proline iminopeptidase-family hydrolase [Bacteroidetes bacterium]|nr:proline iminopeptidase-family hydrolase [Bacteroidota bacterium]MBS1649164.1 proline iminopeptidase-family hydrolase [Bacteroidota bacterium]
MRKIFFFLLILPLFFLSCNQNKTTLSLEEYFATTDTGVQTGGVKMIPIKTEKGTFKVWTKRIGNNPKIKVLLLHGGPGGTHEAFECFESFMPKEGIEIIEYDQLESYYSDKPNDSSLWTTEHFIDEVEQVRKALNLNKDNFYLLGHSWGGILAIEYALKYQDNIKGLIISNMVASIPEYEKYNVILRNKMRKTLVDSLMNYEAKGMFKDTTYQRLVLTEYYAQHICRLSEWPEPINRMFSHLNEGIYVSMQGPSEFKTGGRLLHWDRSKDLNKINVPTLTIGGEFDTMDPNYMKWMATQVKNGNYLYCPNGSHCSMWDDQAHYFPGLISFIKSVNENKFKPIKN